jgi:hypothetical protein
VSVLPSNVMLAVLSPHHQARSNLINKPALVHKW